VRAVEAAQLEHAYEQTLLRVAADPSCADAAELPAGAAQELGEVRATVALLAAAAADDAEAMKGARTHLAKLRRLLKSSERNRDLFAQAGGVSAVMALYTEDNQAVLVSCRGGGALWGVCLAGPFGRGCVRRGRLGPRPDRALKA
jgi:hypothetical protein